MKIKKLKKKLKSVKKKIFKKEPKDKSTDLQKKIFFQHHEQGVCNLQGRKFKNDSNKSKRTTYQTVKQDLKKKKSK